MGKLRNEALDVPYSGWKKHRMHMRWNMWAWKAALHAPNLSTICEARRYPDVKSTARTFDETRGHQIPQCMRTICAQFAHRSKRARTENLTDQRKYMRCNVWICIDRTRVVNLARCCAREPFLPPGRSGPVSAQLPHVTLCSHRTYVCTCSYNLHCPC